jgi:hypothetical protein
VFAHTSGAVFDRLALTFDDLPAEMQGAVFCGHDNVEDGCTAEVDAAYNAAVGSGTITEAEIHAFRQTKNARLEWCNRGCAFQFYLGPAGAGSHPHVHGSAFNLLVRGKKRWFVYPPEYVLRPSSFWTLFVFGCLDVVAFTRFSSLCLARLGRITCMHGAAIVHSCRARPCRKMVRSKFVLE